METIGFVLAALIGVALGMLGGGGSIVTVPALVYLLGFGVKEAIATSLAVVGATSLLGAISHWRVGNVNVRVAAIFGVVAMAGTYLGARLSVFFSGAAQMILFAVVMLGAAYFMYRGTPLGVSAAPEGEPPEVADIPLPLIVIEGVAVGILTGLVGVGGGFLIVPALVLLGRVPMREAIGTSLVVIAMKSAAGFAGYLDQVAIDWQFIAIFTGIATLGILLGTHLVGFVSQLRLQRAFAIFLLVMGSWLLYQNRGVVLARESSIDSDATATVSGSAPYISVLDR